MKNIQLAEWIGTVCKIGRIPGAPGTWGSLAAVIVWFYLPETDYRIFSVIILFIGLIGVQVSTSLENFYDTDDPGYIVIDEWVGQWIALIALPKTWEIGLIAFLLFRLFDIAKPWPINRLQKLSKGWGVMADDVVAGLFALIFTHLLRIYLL